MKKTYMKPTMDVTQIQLEQVIATSDIRLISDSPASSTTDTGLTMDSKDWDDYDEDLW
jgi:hypothetical protein